MVTPVTRHGRDAADRLLAAAVRLLPVGRYQWGQAMQAELAAVTGRTERWRFAVGCMAAAVRQIAPTRVGWHPVLSACVVAVVLAGEVAVTQVFGQTVPLVLVLALLAWRGRRAGLFGPVRPDRATRIVRAGGYVIVGLCLVFAAGSGGRFHAATGGVAKLLRPGPRVPAVALLVAFFSGPL